MGVDAPASGERAQREPGMDRTDMLADEGSSRNPLTRSPKPVGGASSISSAFWT